mmetsp:Transcript_24785/g.58162  ORF Transcript_24785/g.58162 Transcript_24785/m.58162 type:complete len:145 (+) Transcript_24785:162-596(+)
MDSRTDKQNRKNTTLDVPWDHYTFNLPGDADLQPALRRKVEILETTEGFCMFYPKQRPGMERNDSSYRSKECEWNAQTVHKGRDVNASFRCDSSVGTCATSRSDSARGENNSRSSRSGRPVFISRQSENGWKKNRRRLFCRKII